MSRDERLSEPLRGWTNARRGKLTASRFSGERPNIAKKTPTSVLCCISNTTKSSTISTINWPDQRNGQGFVAACTYRNADELAARIAGSPGRLKMRFEAGIYVYFVMLSCDKHSETCVDEHQAVPLCRFRQPSGSISECVR